jgi:pimeloyl-ACP methyl ester carboxylesterase
MPVAPVLLDASRDDEAKAAAMVNDWSFSGGQIGGSAAPGMWLLGINKRLMARQPRGTFFRDMSACNAYARAPESLAGVSVPTLIVAGAQDKMTPLRAAKALEKAIPGAKLTVIPGCGHALMAERPDAVLDALRVFIGG